MQEAKATMPGMHQMLKRNLSFSKLLTALPGLFATIVSNAQVQSLLLPTARRCDLSNHLSGIKCSSAISPVPTRDHSVFEFTPRRIKCSSAISPVPTAHKQSKPRKHIEMLSFEKF